MLTLLFVVFCVGLTAAQECDPAKCENYAINSHYYDLNCKPVYGESDKCCPTHFDCPLLERMSSTPDKCFYAGKEYKKGEKISDEDLKGKCSAGCSCQEGYPNNTPSIFNCAHIECPDLFVPRKKNCRGIYTLDQCCSVKEACDETRSNVKQCTSEGKTYLEGDRIYLKSDTCKECLCESNGEVKCQQISCGVLLYRANDLRKHCAPVYYGKNRCCPISYICHEDKHKVVSSPNPPNPSIGSCKFGSLSLNLGDEITNVEKCTTCSCISPPLATCIQDPDCDRFH